jgi:hypothetical protein
MLQVDGSAGGGRRGGGEGTVPETVNMLELAPAGVSLPQLQIRSETSRIRTTSKLHTKGAGSRSEATAATVRERSQRCWH